MKVLVDTHIAIWITEDSGSLTRNIIQVVTDPGNTVFISTVAIWEIAIKYGKGGLRLHPREARAGFRLAGLTELAVTADHMEEVASLPQYPDHSDPFDRIMIAQALSEAMPLLTADKKLWRYHQTLVIPA
ncbi:type II toxin-antitoxin system VapC family toxin [Phyllobacterium endophyticum]|uniref:type II toxin-antitoxin system VapC family toxin n=1 Tax=Phyllobacterium endophyticum TaxID=1149773 RepID=UPI0011CADF90|nr:type II toxin-antitoxin system VapC family toxin [Phyllobacterium endophyticum]TXR46966.1 type II toxin-antitoxin system VapC family toxin [Phyllobacterium endophyticum]